MPVCIILTDHVIQIFLKFSIFFFTLSNYIRGFFISYDDEGNPEIFERKWDRNKFHFDDIGAAMLTLCTVSTFEGWPE